MSAQSLNKTATHPLQTFEWGEFRKKTGVKVLRTDNFQLTIHRVPLLGSNIGYLPKGKMPDKKMIQELKKIGKEEKCIFLQIEPNVRRYETGDLKLDIGGSRLRRAAHPLFTKYTFVLDLTKSEEELLKNMHSKTRYNIKVAQKNGVEVVEDNSEKAFKDYLKLTFETTQRQKFFAHDENYHKLMWETLRTENGKLKTNKLTAHLLLAKYKGKTLVAWVVFVFKDTLYYPYGASSSENREVMASNLMMWEAIRFGKKLGLKKFDMWGSLGPEPNPKDPWFGFHRFKQGYGAELVEFVGSYDLVIDPLKYVVFKVLDKLRWLLLSFR